ncbi:MAG: hypothetical protein ACXWQO_14275 [Bdellovibrionota bacterium]
MRASRLLSLLLLITACSRGVPDKTAASVETATFVVDPVTATVTGMHSDPNFSNLATARSYDFSACVKSVANLDPVIGVNFVIREGDRSVGESTSDASGCLHWSEPFQFSQMSDETYYELDRSIEATSVHKGKQALRLAVNPWKGGNEALLDLRFHSVPKIVTQGQKSKAPAAAFFVDSVGVQMELKRGQGNIPEAALRLSFSPKIKRNSIDGQIVQETLGSGRIAVTAQIVASTPKSVIPLTAQANFTKQQFSQGKVQIEASASLLRKAPREAMLDLMIAITPIDAPEGIQPIRGRVPLGQLTGLTINREAVLREDPSLVFFDAAQIAAVGPAASPYTFVPGQVNAEKAVVEEMDSSGKPSKVRFQLYSCLFNSVSLDKILNIPFTVEIDGAAQDLTTDSERGCVRWQVSVPFSYFSKEGFTRKEVEFKSANGMYGNDSVKRVIHLDPWRYNDLRNSVVDEFYEGKPMVAASDQGPASELIVNDTAFQFVGRSFDVDNRLNLSVTRKYKMVIRPSLKRMSRDSGWLPAEGIGNGRFLVRVLLETADQDQPRVIDSFTREVDSQADLITIEDAAFRFEDLRLVASRNQISIEVDPIDSSAGLVSRPGVGWLDALNWGTVRMNPRNTSIVDKVKAKAISTDLVSSGSDLLAKGTNLKKMDDAALAQIGLQGADLSSAAGGNAREVLRKFCDLFFEPGFLSPHTFCRLRPESYLSLATTEHVAKVYSSALAGAPDSYDFTMSAGITMAAYESDDAAKGQSTTWSAGGEAKLGVPVSGITGLDIGVGVGYGKNWSSSTTFTKGKSNGQNRVTSVTKNLKVDEVKFTIDADIEKCFLVSSELTKNRNPRGYLACAPNPERRVVNETYYLLQQDMRPSALVDTDTVPDQKPFLFLLRGQTRFKELAKLLQSANLTIQVGNDLPLPAEIMKESQGSYDGFYPGLLSPKN